MQSEAVRAERDPASLTAVSEREDHVVLALQYFWWLSNEKKSEQECDLQYISEWGGFGLEILFDTSNEDGCNQGSVFQYE